MDRTALLWDISTGKALTPFMQHNEQILGSNLNHDGSRILTWCEDGTVHLWDSGTGKTITSFKHDKAVKGARLSEDGSRALTWSKDLTGYMWNLDSDHILSPKDLILKLEVQTGTCLNEDLGELEELSIVGWKDKKNDLISAK